MKEEVQELIRKVRDYEIRIRKAINTMGHGDYHSVFKGSGLEFDDVRAYQYGDDVRHIDWNVSAKGHGTYVKTFRDDKEQNVFLLVDVSASQEIGLPGQTKIDMTKQIAGVLALSAIKESANVGMLCYSDQKERYVKPGKGQKHGIRLMSELFKLTPKSKGTHLCKGILTALNLLKRKTLVIMVSDFVDEGFDKDFRALARKHDLIAVHIADKRETRFPALGIVPIRDKETGKTKWINSSAGHFRSRLNALYAGKRASLEDQCKRYRADYLFLHTDEDFVPKLVRLFRVRKHVVK